MNQEQIKESMTTSRKEKRDKANDKAEKILFFSATELTVNLFAIAIFHGSIFTIDRTDPTVLVIAGIYLVVSIVTLILCIGSYRELKALGVNGYNYMLGAGISMVVFAIIIFPLNIAFMFFAIMAFLILHKEKTEDNYVELLKERDKEKENNSSND